MVGMFFRGATIARTHKPATAPILDSLKAQQASIRVDMARLPADAHDRRREMQARIDRLDQIATIAEGRAA